MFLTIVKIQTLQEPMTLNQKCSVPELHTLFHTLTKFCFSFLGTGVYGLCDGPKLSRGPYLMITMICSVSSLIYVSLKAAFVFGEPANGDGGGSYFKAAEVALFLCSSVLAIGHIVVAYRTSCRERRKLLVFKIDIEAVSLLTLLLPPHYINLLF